jgi:histidinol dehydrogenase
VRLFKEGEKGFEKYLREVEQRATFESLRLEKKVRSILEEVRKEGDRALLHYTQVFDGVNLQARRLQLTKRELDQAFKKVPRDFFRTLEKAAHRIRRFHRLMKKSYLPVRGTSEWKERGIVLGQMVRPLERVGIYVPGGKASYPSTVLMAAIPAKVAGVKEIIMTTPPGEDGISPAVLAAADLAGVDRIYRIGGVQAIGGLAYGTESIPKVDKIVGPGNRYVATAKRLVYGVVDVDMVAGPSEILIISDEKTPSSFVAADLISQAEHDEMALPILVTLSVAFGEEVRKEVGRQLSLSKRASVARKSLNGRGAILIVKDLDRAIALANRIAPEHLELSFPKAHSFTKKVDHAGSVFLGIHTPEAIGDYMAGSNHILPTGATARFSSPLGVEDFIKRLNLIRFSRDALKRFEKDVQRFTEWEGLKGHYEAVKVRLRKP